MQNRGDKVILARSRAFGCTSWLSLPAAASSRHILARSSDLGSSRRPFRSSKFFARLSSCEGVLRAHSSALGTVSKGLPLPDLACIGQQTSRWAGNASKTQHKREEADLLRAPDSLPPVLRSSTHSLSWYSICSASLINIGPLTPRTISHASREEKDIRNSLLTLARERPLAGRGW